MEYNDFKHLEEWAERVKREYSIEYNLEGVRKIEEEISRIRPSFKDLTEGKQNALVHSFGAYLGTCMIINYGGTWFKHEHNVGVKIDSSDFFTNPFQKVWKQFQEDGQFDSISSYYEITSNIDKIVSSHLSKLDKKNKPWWKFW